jgi:hypothetical protein
MRAVRGAGLLAAKCFAGSALAISLCSLGAQQGPNQREPNAPAPTKPAAQGEPTAAVQEPGEGAQLKTGTASGLDIETRLENLLADHEYLRIQEQIGELPPELAGIYRGVLANRSNKLEQSVELLEPLVDAVTASGNAAREKLVRMTLAEDYLRLGDWAKASTAYQTLDQRLHTELSQDEQDEIEMPLKMLPLAKDDPPTTVDPCEPFRLQVSDDPLGLIDVPVFIDAASHSWMLDPTAPFNLVSRSIAREVGLGISKESATIRTLTGKPIEVHVTVIPRFTIGGRLTLHNVTAFVFDDADYFFPHSRYQVEGVLGYPALAAMGRITVSDNTIQVDPAKEIDPQIDKDRLNTGAHFYLDGDEMIVALERAAHSSGGDQIASPGGKSDPEGAGSTDERMFAIDAGGQQTYLTSRWFDEHAAEFNRQKTQMFSFEGRDSAPVPSYTATTVPLSIGGAEVDLHYIPVLTLPLGSAARDDVYGVLGIDALDQFRSYTFDYRTMRFSAKGQ